MEPLVRVKGGSISAAWGVETGALRLLNIWASNDLDQASCEALLGIDLGRDLPADGPLTEEQAVRVTEAWAARLEIDLGDNLERRVTEHLNTQGEWLLVWYRMIGGFKFANEAVTIRIADTSGLLRSASCGVTDLAISTELSLEKHEAERIASKAASRILEYYGTSGQQYEASIQVEAPVVRYTNGRQIGDVAPISPVSSVGDAIGPVPKLVYEVRITFRYSGGRRQLYTEYAPATVYVSAEDGSILGGSW